VYRKHTLDFQAVTGRDARSDRVAAVQQSRQIAEEENINAQKRIEPGYPNEVTNRIPMALTQIGGLQAKLLTNHTNNDGLLSRCRPPSPVLVIIYS